MGQTPGPRLGQYSGKELNFSSKFTVSKTLSIPSSLITFLKKLFFPALICLSGETFATGRGSIGASTLDGTSNGDEQLTLICAGVGPNTNLQRLGIKSPFVRGTGSVGRFITVENIFCGMVFNGLSGIWGMATSGLPDVFGIVCGGGLRGICDMVSSGLPDVGGRGCFISVMDVGIGK